MMFRICYIISLIEKTEVKFGRNEKFVPMDSFSNDTLFLHNNRMESELRLWILGLPSVFVTFHREMKIWSVISTVPNIKSYK